MDKNSKEYQIRIVIEQIRPYIQRDGGDLEFVDYKDGIVKVRFLGACVGCMSIGSTLKDGVEAILKDEVEGIKEVVLADA